MMSGASQIVSIFEDIQRKVPYVMELASGGFVDAVQNVVSDVDISVVITSFKTLNLEPLVLLPVEPGDQREDRWIYRVAGYARPVNIFATADAERAARSAKHRANELMLNEHFPELAFAAAILKSNGAKTEIAWATVLGFDGNYDPYDIMSRSEVFLIDKAHSISVRTRNILRESALPKKPKIGDIE